jgi:hypothetical protein
LSTKKPAPAPAYGDRVAVKPKGGAHVRDPESAELLAPEGQDVTWSEFWVRRQADDDIAFVEPQPPEPKK